MLHLTGTCDNQTMNQAHLYCQSEVSAKNSWDMEQYHNNFGVNIQASIIIITWSVSKTSRHDFYLFGQKCVHVPGPLADLGWSVHYVDDGFGGHYCYKDSVNWFFWCHFNVYNHDQLCSQPSIYIETLCWVTDAHEEKTIESLCRRRK